MHLMYPGVPNNYPTDILLYICVTHAKQEESIAVLYSLPLLHYSLTDHKVPFPQIPLSSTSSILTFLRNFRTHQFISLIVICPQALTFRFPI